MLKTFREWLSEEDLNEEDEKWITCHGFKIAFNPKTKKITKGKFAGSSLDELKDKLKGLGEQH